MQQPNRNSGQNDNPYNPYTQDAQNWENRRQQLIDEENRRRAYDAVLKQQHEEEQSRIRREEQKRRAREEEKSRKIQAQKQNKANQKYNKQSNKKDKNKGNKQAVGIFALICFFIVAGITYSKTQDNMITSIVAGLLAGFIASKWTKTVIFILILIGAILIFAPKQ